MAETTKKKTVKDDYVTYKLPKEAPGQANYQLVVVNGKTYKIKKGVTVNLPREVAEVLYNSERAEAAATDYIEANTSV